MNTLIDYKEVYEKLGRLVKAARINAGLTQEDLASIISVSRTSISNIEAGRQKILLHTLYEIALGLGVDYRDLLPDIGVRSDLSAQVPDELDSDAQEWIASILSKLNEED